MIGIKNNGRLSFETQLETEFLPLNNGSKKFLEKSVKVLLVEYAWLPRHDCLVSVSH